MTDSRVREATTLDDAPVLQLMTEYMTWALATFEATYGFAMEMEPEHTAASLDKFRRPMGLLALAEVDGVPAGVAALRVLDDGIDGVDGVVVELKRMFVRPEHRGAGLGAEMLDWLLTRSRDDFGARTIRLDSNRFMTDAHRLYESRGFTERAAYPGSEIPADLQRLWRFYELHPA